MCNVYSNRCISLDHHGSGHNVIIFERLAHIWAAADISRYTQEGPRATFDLTSSYGRLDNRGLKWKSKRAPSSPPFLFSIVPLFVRAGRLLANWRESDVRKRDAFIPLENFKKKSKLLVELQTKMWEKTDRKGDWVQRLKRYCVYIIAVKNIIAVKPHEEHRHNLCSTSPSLWDNPPSSIYFASGPFSFKVYCLMFNGFRSRHLKVISDSTFQARCVVIRGDNPRTSSVL